MEPAAAGENLMPKMGRYDSRHGPMDEDIRKVANDIGRIIGMALPKEYGFALLIFGLGESDGRMNYISNASREDMLAALKELIARFEGRYTDESGTA
jgi:hypothetical protein